jgi:hypothetical protein
MLPVEGKNRAKAWAIRLACLAAGFWMFRKYAWVLVFSIVGTVLAAACEKRFGRRNRRDDQMPGPG